MQTELSGERGLFLSTGLAGHREVWFALAAVLVSGLVFLAALPLATIQLAAIPAFIPAYESALVICDLITAVLLFGQFNFLRSRALFVLASGYLFTAYCLRARAHFPWRVLSHRMARRRSPDHGVAVHVLAWRLPAFCHRLRAAQGGGE